MRSGIGSCGNNFASTMLDLIAISHGLHAADGANKRRSTRASLSQTRDQSLDPQRISAA